MFHAQVSYTTNTYLPRPVVTYYVQTQKDVFLGLVREFVESTLEEMLLHEVHRYSTL